MTSRIGVWLDQDPANALWTQDQRALIQHLIGCSGLANPEAALELADPALTDLQDPTINAPGTAWLAIGNGARRALSRLARAAMDADWPDLAVGATHPDRMSRLQTLVLLAPHLPADAFRDNRVAALALTHVNRVVVLHGPKDQRSHADERAAGMARSGPGVQPDKIDVVDLTPLIELHEDAIRGALCSYEAMGLMVRLMRGIAPARALPAAARSAS